MRFPDWNVLDTAERALLSGGAAGFARQLDLKLHAFAAFEIEGTPAHGILDGMP